MGINYIYHSNDGGDKWRRQSLPADTFNLREFCFLNENVGYIIGEMGLILKTSDGGKSWQKQKSGANNTNLMGLSFIDENTGWITGERYEPRGGILLHTTTGGTKWDTLSDRSDSILYYDVKFADENNGIIIGSYGFDNFTPINVYRTYNGGKTLTEISEFSGAHTRYLFLNNIDTLWTGGFGFAKSLDGGFTWDANYLFELKDSTLYGPPIFFNMLQINGKTGWAAVTYFSKSSELHYTDDYGYSWKLVNIPETFYPTSLTLSGKYLFVGGAYGFIMTNKPSTVDVNKEKQKEYTFNLQQNYPNPFNNTTVFKYILKYDSYIKVQLFNIIGAEIATILNENKLAGEYSLTLNSDKYFLSSDVYYIKISVIPFNKVSPEANKIIKTLLLK